MYTCVIHAYAMTVLDCSVRAPRCDDGAPRSAGAAQQAWTRAERSHRRPRALLTITMMTMMIIIMIIITSCTAINYYQYCYYY